MPFGVRRHAESHPSDPPIRRGELEPYTILVGVGDGFCVCRHPCANVCCQRVDPGGLTRRRRELDMLKPARALRFLGGMVVLLMPALARGEGFLDFAIGGAFTQKSNVTFKSGGSSVTTEADFDDSFATGVRGGYWFDGLPWLGVGGMVSYFQPDVRPAGASGYDSRSLGVVPISALLMLRVPLLASNAVPRGQLQPYLAVGPGAFVTVTDNNNNYNYNYNHGYHYNSQSSVDVGVDVHAGATWMFTSRFGMFGEYRFTHYTANIDGDSYYNRYNVSLESTLDTNHVMAGFAWHFD